ncbi:MAG: hypothetical protein BWK79_11265 [Beggiatoa sp. IS2]|nr:MAG: hypothetical protein BWK79_11265 [Beggiatoa sp. IS2]
MDYRVPTRITMTLRKKTLLMVGTALVGLVILLFSFSSTILLKGFTQLERKIAEKNVNRVVNLLSEELNSLGVEAADYAFWDDAYRFMQTLDKTFTEVNFVENTFDSLNLNLIALIDLQGQVIFGYGHDMGHHGLQPLPQILFDHLGKESLLIYRPDTHGKVTGLLRSDEHILLIAIRPILTSHEQGPCLGTLIMGRYLDVKAINRLSKLTNLIVDTQLTDRTKSPNDFTEATLELLDSGQSIVVKVLDQHTIAGYTLLKDISQQPAVLLRVKMFRETYEQGLTSLAYLNIFVLVSAIVFSSLILWLFERLVLARLAILNEEVKRIPTTGDLLTVTVESEDELAHLAMAINDMLKALHAQSARISHNEASLAEAQRIAHLGNWTLDITHNCFAWSDEIFRIFGHEPRSFIPSYEIFLHTAHPDDRQKVSQAIDNAVNNDHPYNIEYRIIQKNGTERIVHTQGEVLRDAKGHALQMLGTLQDITERKQIQAETLRLLEENRFLIHRSIAIQEAERRNLSRELHDEFGQCITAIQADAETIVETAQIAVTPENLQRISVSANAILEVSTHIYSVVHSLMRQLRPTGLDELGLIEILQESVKSWQNRHPEVRCTFTITGNFENLGESINITIYRIVQECLTNIAKYARATHVSITLVADLTTQQLTLRVQDDGHGMNLVRHKRGLGLIGMRERIAALEGLFSLESVPGQGVTITAAIPIAEEYLMKHRPWRKTKEK